METKELRIGDYLKFKNTNDLAIVELIHKKHFDCRDENGIFTPNGNYEPIPLTEEWLLKLGFYKAEDLGDMIYYEHKKLKYFNVELDHDEWVLNFEIGDGQVCIFYDNPAFQFVHQLQNLYFALTGKELTIKTKN